VKWVAIGVGVLVALFVGSALVVGTLEGLGVIDAPEEDSEKSSESAKSDRGGGSDGQLQKDRSGRPLLRVTDVELVEVDAPDGRDLFEGWQADEGSGDGRHVDI